MWQDKYVQWIGVTVGFLFPAVLGWTYQHNWAGALGGFLFGGVARVVAVQHCTFFINSACHTFGNQPYSVKCSARDSWLMAFFTFGEGYHNYHHEFQYDYRNGVKPWQWDPTKWAIWAMQKLGLTQNLRRVPSEKIILAQIVEAQRVLELKLASSAIVLPESTRTLLQASQDYLTELNNRWAVQRREYTKLTEQTLESSREKMNELSEELKMALAHLKFASRPSRRRCSRPDYFPFLQTGRLNQPSGFLFLGPGTLSLPPFLPGNEYPCQYQCYAQRLHRHDRFVQNHGGGKGSGQRLDEQTDGCHCRRQPSDAVGDQPLAARVNQ